MQDTEERRRTLPSIFAGTTPPPVDDGESAAARAQAAAQRERQRAEERARAQQVVAPSERKAQAELEIRNVMAARRRVLPFVIVVFVAAVISFVIFLTRHDTSEKKTEDSHAKSSITRDLAYARTMGAVFGVVGGVLFVAGLLVVFARYNNGRWFWQEQWFYKHGVSARATVLQKNERNYHHTNGRVPYYQFELVLEVHPEGRAPFRTVAHEIFQKLDPLGDEGTTIPVRIDPNDDTRVMLDFRKRDAEERKTKAAAMSDADARKTALLANRNDGTK